MREARVYAKKEGELKKTETVTMSELRQSGMGAVSLVWAVWGESNLGVYRSG